MSEEKHIVIIWSRYLPYHVARIRHLRDRLREVNCRLTAIEVASKDALYPFPESAESSSIEYRCIFSGKSYRALNPLVISFTIYRAIVELHPDVVIAPATPFPSGMAAIRYALLHHKFSIMMDDAWEFSDQRGKIITMVKKFIHQNIDAAFIPAPSHAQYFGRMGFPKERMVFGVDVVDNEYYSRHAQVARDHDSELRKTLSLPKKYFLFVGRFIPRKGIESLLKAYLIYRNTTRAPEPWGLVLVGDGDARKKYQLEVAPRRHQPDIVFAGSQFGEKLCYYYGLASAFILPSEVETWGLVVNEALASGLPAIVSKGCGSAQVLIDEKKNGFTFTYGNSTEIAEYMETIAALPSAELTAMADHSKKIIANWSLNTFADSVIRAIQLPRRERGSWISQFFTVFWPGRISFYP